MCDEHATVGATCMRRVSSNAMVAGWTCRSAGEAEEEGRGSGQSEDGGVERWHVGVPERATERLPRRGHLMQLGFVGTGTMGNAMARYLIEAGHQLTVHDLQREATINLCDLGARWADTPR